MKTKILAYIVAFTTLLSGCNLISPLLSQLSPDVYDGSRYQNEFAHHWQYGTLNADEKAFYGCLYTAVKDTMAKDVTVQYTDENRQSHEMPGVRVTMPGEAMTNESIIRLYKAFFTDNPQFFYLDRVYSMEGHKNIGGDIRYDTLILQYAMPVEQRIQAVKDIQAITDIIFSERPSTTDEYEIELYLHDRLNRLCTYDTVAAESSAEANPNAYTIYGTFVEGKAVCEGYAKAMQLLLHKASIPATLVTGTAKENGEAHMWNIVKINGADYYLDPTWNDSNDQEQHTFFNLTTEMITATYTIDEGENVPLCNAVQDNYFIRTDTTIDTYERQVIAQKIAARIRAGDTTVQLRFAEGKYENGILFLKNKKLLTDMVNGHLSDSELTMWDYDLWARNEQQVLTMVKK